MVLSIITAVFLLAYAALIFFYQRQWRKLSTYTPATNESDTFVTVLIAARNEEATLPLLINDLLQQTYPAQLFEVLIINDYSTDGTANVLNTITVEHIRMIVPDVAADQSSKKRAIATGVKKAKGELLLITDADCRVGKDWIKTAASFYKEHGAAFMAAPVKFSHNNSVVQIFQSLDFMVLQGITAASVGAGFHTMCNGANLAYTKQAFNSVNGFAGIDKVATGDDMLLMHKIWKQQPGNVFYLKAEAAVVATEPMRTWAEFLSQRKRWASKTLVYEDSKIIAVLAFVLLFNLLPFIILIAAFFNSTFWLLLGSYLAVKTIIEWPFVSSVAKFYKEEALMNYFILFQPLHIFYTVAVGLVSQLGKYSWKGRRVR